MATIEELLRLEPVAPEPRTAPDVRPFRLPGGRMMNEQEIAYVREHGYPPRKPGEFADDYQKRIRAYLDSAPAADSSMEMVDRSTRNLIAEQAEKYGQPIRGGRRYDFNEPDVVEGDLPQAPPVPAVARGAAGRARQARAEMSERGTEEVAQSLFKKLIVGGGSVRGDVSGGNIVAYSEIPKAIRDRIPMKAPPIGWDVSELSPAELELLTKMRYVGYRDDRAEARDERRERRERNMMLVEGAKELTRRGEGDVTQELMQAVGGDVEKVIGKKAPADLSPAAKLLWYRMGGDV